MIPATTPMDSAMSRTVFFSGLWSGLRAAASPGPAAGGTSLTTGSDTPLCCLTRAAAAESAGSHAQGGARSGTRHALRTGDGGVDDDHFDRPEQRQARHPHDRPTGLMIDHGALVGALVLTERPEALDLHLDVARHW